MPGEIIVAICSLIGTLSGSLLGSQLTKWRIEQLEKKVDKHNGLVERMAIAERDLKSAWRVIDELKEK